MHHGVCMCQIISCSFFSCFIDRYISEILFQGCQSGKRSLMAATELCSAVSMITPIIYLYCTPNTNNRLLDLCWFSPCNHFQGFTAVTDIAGGFSSWRDNGLPITQWSELASNLYLTEAQHHVKAAKLKDCTSVHNVLLGFQNNSTE